MRYSTIINQLELRKARIAAERDKLRELQEEIEAHADICERATESLDDAIAALSELV